MKAVTSETRAACCMLWVTATIVYSSVSDDMSSSMMAVAIGSSDAVGSSISKTSGSRGNRARDAEPLLLAAGESQRARIELILHFIPQRGRAQRAFRGF